ncbi:ABC transporter substrate-binding protein [Natronobacterium texcoconense]|uniref:Peptide/nickel transport system substrate-binding protein n=1 Tax=Natronobacterium texcoconense TaxID=1095778 RepID=A0A1H1EG84_NATTX|nr:ABC transporter substrate-binding protein [Natronobacterium texcoconense]SDQ87805.1 peptide/nickel transport system substrate-binding protein [Natronobacterium texcoconense]
MQGADRPNYGRRTVLKLSGVAGAASLTGLAGCLDDPEGDDADELVITQGEFIENPDPNDHITGPYFNILDAVYEPLFDVTPEFEFQSRVVEEWEDTGDGAAELTIRDDVQFHNGEELTAEDVAYTFNRQIDDELGVESDQAAGLGAIDEAEAVDDTTVRLEHGVAPSLAEYEYANYGRAVNQEWIEDQEQPVAGDDADAFNGTGPFEVVEYEPDVRIVLEPFEDYWGEVPDIERVVFNADGESSGRVNALEAGESDIVDNVIPEDVADVDETDGIEIRNETSLRNVFLVMKSGVEPFDSQEFRQAMNYAVDNEEIIETVLGGFADPMSQPIPEGVFGYNPDLDPYSQDLERAEELVEESGHEDVEITLHAPEGRYLNDADVAQTAADHIDQLDNVDCDVDIVPFPDISDANSAGYDDEEMPFFLIGWGVITGDSDYGLAPFFVEEAPLETLRNEDVSEQILESQEIEDEGEREQALQDINEELREEAPWVFLHSQDSVYGVREDIDWEPRMDESIYLWEMET